MIEWRVTVMVMIIREKVLGTNDVAIRTQKTKKTTDPNNMLKQNHYI